MPIYTIKIVSDDEPANPRDDDNLTHMVCGHRRYNLGDEQTSAAFRGVDCSSWADVRNVIERQDKPAVILPLYLYDHGGLDIATSRDKRGWYHAAWDAGQVGWVYITKDKARQTFGWKHITASHRQHLLEILQEEVKTYAHYLSDDVYGFRVLDEDGCVVESSYGYFGIGDAKTAAQDYIDHGHEPGVHVIWDED